MRHGRGTASTWQGWTIAVLLPLAVAACAETPPTPAAPAPVAQATPTPAASAPVPPELAALSNDPSAPADSPLCGTAARESDAISQALLPRRYAEAGSCAAYTCYDAATATYLGADGYRHVCR